MFYIFKYIYFLTIPFTSLVSLFRPAEKTGTKILETPSSLIPTIPEILAIPSNQDLGFFCCQWYKYQLLLL
jgi:hypothetical protein